jgi:S1-C subfamily serine protease
VQVGYRTLAADGSWLYTPRALRIRDADGKPLWTENPRHDVAAITVKAPPAFAKAAIPLNYLATGRETARNRIAPGEELFVLGFPLGVSANGAGFPILRSGRVASYPVSPQHSPTFLLDFSVFPGNSGGPVFITPALQRTSSAPAHPLIAGILTQQVEVAGQPLGIGVVVHARYIAETVDLLYGGRRPGMVAPDPPAAADVQPVVASRPPPLPAWRRSLGHLGAAVVQVGEAVAVIWRWYLGLFGAHGHASAAAIGR